MQQMSPARPIPKLPHVRGRGRPRVHYCRGAVPCLKRRPETALAPTDPRDSTVQISERSPASFQARVSSLPVPCRGKESRLLWMTPLEAAAVRAVRAVRAAGSWSCDRAAACAFATIRKECRAYWVPCWTRKKRKAEGYEKVGVRKSSSQGLGKRTQHEKTRHV
eukprot:351236-Chlamydomonas_euryale.AAC.9